VSVFPSGPYVYALVDPRDSAVFYIGKGTGRRMYQHERDVMRGKTKNAAKTGRIAEILAAGLRVVCRVLAVFTSDAEAFKAERQFIAAHADLTNATAGGGGSRTGATKQDGERQESPEVTKRNALDLLSRIVPYMDWINEKPRTNEESDTYMSVVADLHEIIGVCDRQLSQA
jgi:hypothetical protein